MTYVATGVIIKGKGQGIQTIMNDIVENEMERQLQLKQQQYEREIESLQQAIERRDKITEMRHRELGKKLAEYKAALNPKPSILRKIKEYYLFAILVPMCAIHMITRR